MIFLLIANSPSSVINFRLDLIKAIQASGQVVHVACPGMSEDRHERVMLEALGVWVHSFPMSRVGVNPLVDLKTLWALHHLIRQLQPRRILSYTIKPVVWGTLAGFINRVPQRYALITGLGYAFVEDEAANKKRLLVRRVSLWLYSLSLACCHKVFFQNPDDEAFFRQLGILKNKNLSAVVKGSGVNLTRFQPAPLPKQLTFLLVARLLVVKGVRLYAEAARQLKERYPEVSFKLVGYLDKNPESITQEELDTWIAEGYIEYLGKVSDVRPALSAASVFVLPSFYREGIPRTILEALAMGRAVITTDAPGCRETVTHGKNGYLVQPQSAEELTEAIEKLIEHPELVAQMGQISLKRAQDEFDVHKVNKAMMKGMTIIG